MPERHDWIADELLMIRHSGELPEVALHASLHHLQQSEEGPLLTLTHAERRTLALAAAARYQTIILRDLTPANRASRHFRGLARALVNWRRYVRFRSRHNLDDLSDFEAFQREAGRALIASLVQECTETAAGLRQPSVNCPASDILALAEALYVREALPEGWKRLCMTAT